MVFNQEILQYGCMILKHAEKFPDVQTFVSAMIAFECHVPNVSFISLTSMCDKVSNHVWGINESKHYDKVSNLAILFYNVLERTLNGTSADVNSAMELLKAVHASFVLKEIK